MLEMQTMLVSFNLQVTKQTSGIEKWYHFYLETIHVFPSEYFMINLKTK